MNRQEMIKKLDRVSDLPTLPSVVMKINHLFQDINTPIEKLIDLLEKDQSMVLKILRLVNSSFYGFRSKISDLKHAVTLMGYSTIQNAVVTVAIIDSMKMKTTLKDFDVSIFWTHSISVAVMCRRLAALSRLAPPDEAFTAGLVHDIGKVVLVRYFSETFSSIVETMSHEQMTFYDAEKSKNTYPHNLIGSTLARRWMLPEAIDLAVRHHHGEPPAGSGFPLIGLVTIADTLVNIMAKVSGYGLNTEAIPESVREPLMPILQDSDQWFPKVKEEVTSACDFFKKEIT